MTEIEQLRAENARLAEALVDAMIVPEAWMISGRPIGISDEAWAQIQRSVHFARAALSADPAPVVDAWQSIDNITPDAGHVLLLGSTRHDARTIFTGWIAQNGMIYGDAWGLDCKPTHWMPLPKPPDGENGND